MTRRALCAASLALGCAARVGAQTDPARAEDAMAFIRLVGDLRVDYRDARQPVVRPNVEVGTGSGFVIAPSGLVLTSLHVVEAEPATREDGPEVTVENARIQVFVGSEGSEGAFEAHVVASDAANDLAALQVTAADLPYLPFGDSDAIEAGRAVRVLGFPFGRRTEVARRAEADVIPKVTVTGGSLSASRADEQGETRFLQTDAAIQPGNSGGPMLDEDGYVVGVVKMKLAASATGSGAGFTVPVNVVKDFLDASSLLERLPVTRLRPGVRHSLDWKQVAVELPDGFSDRSPSRVLVDAGELGEVGFRVDRWATPWPSAGLEEALLGGGAVPDFVPAPATAGPRVARQRREAVALLNGRPASVVGSAVGSDASGGRFRVEYAIVDLGPEKVAARYLGPADAVAFNLGLLRRSLLSLEAARILAELPLRSLAGAAASALEPSPFANGDGQVLVPRGWSREPATSAGCEALRGAEAGTLARHPSDYTLVLRALRWGRPASSLAPALARCGARAAAQSRAGGSGADAGGSAYAFQLERLGVPIAVRGELLARGGETLLLELEAPVAKLPIVEELYAGWVSQVSRLD